MISWAWVLMLMGRSFNPRLSLICGVMLDVAHVSRIAVSGINLVEPHSQVP